MNPFGCGILLRGGAHCLGYGGGQKKIKHFLGEPQSQRAGVPAACLNPPHAPKTLFDQRTGLDRAVLGASKHAYLIEHLCRLASIFRLMFSDRLLQSEARTPMAS
jgi:hypothetical protein